MIEFITAVGFVALFFAIESGCVKIANAIIVCHNDAMEKSKK